MIINTWKQTNEQTRGKVHLSIFVIQYTHNLLITISGKVLKMNET